MKTPTTLITAAAVAVLAMAAPAVAQPAHTFTLREAHAVAEQYVSPFQPAKVGRCHWAPQDEAICPATVGPVVIGTTSTGQSVSATLTFDITVDRSGWCPAGTVTHRTSPTSGVASGTVGAYWRGCDHGPLGAS